jgi:uncharacterized protein (DUF488 family)
MRSNRQTIRTVGHGTRTVGELASLLNSAGVTTVVDVRRYPTGRRQPHFAKERLLVDLPALGIAYESWSEELGGRRRAQASAPSTSWRNPSFAAYAAYTKEPVFRMALAELERRADQGEAIAIMCAETLWWRCHRRLIADALVHDGFAVRHLIETPPGKLHRWPQVDAILDARSVA